MRNKLVSLSLLSLASALALPALAEGEGKVLYDKKCAICHGKDGVAKRMATGSSNFNDADWQKANDPAAIVKISTDGRGKMKPFKGKLSDDEIRMIAEYIKTLK